MTRIRTLLVANRGEIARRVIRTARSRGIRTVAVYTDPDAGAPHVRDADVAVALGGPASYLDIGAVLDAVRRSGADAVHPGYGFLSENAAFARACAAAGVVFVGPSPESIETMGRKDSAKDVARRAGVPVLPDAVLGDDEDGWRAAAEPVGYPLLVKATAGGGGRGMRLVGGPAELTRAVVAARREAASSFGDPTVFCERHLAGARHVEIQVLGDTHGDAVHLGERECSVQRRHQKVLEESPSPVVDADLRERMGKTAVALVRELGYTGVGTVEYLLDDTSGDFWFLEMNTRLQVEHPVTEEVTGLDLVALQLDVAQGRPLDLVQEDVVLRGHAVEVRLYAEDPSRDHLPSPGPLHRYRHAHGLPGVRFEDGVEAPGEVSAFYDPMLAKVIAHGRDRHEAAARLASAVDTIEVHGTTTNRDLLAGILREPDFLAGETRTDYLDRHPGLASCRSVELVDVHLAAAVAVTTARRRAADPVTRHAPPGFRLLPGSPPPTATWTGPDGRPRTVGYRLGAATGDSDLEFDVAGERRTLAVRDLTGDHVRIVDRGLDHACAVAVHADGSVWVNSADGQTGWTPEPRFRPAAGSADDRDPVAELPGTVVDVRVAPGQPVDAGDVLVVVESMKMEHPVLATRPGTIEEVHVAVGDYVEAQAVLVSFEPTM